MRGMSLSVDQHDVDVDVDVNLQNALTSCQVGTQWVWRSAPQASEMPRFFQCEIS
jgi:hypothetical protein